MLFEASGSLDVGRGVKECFISSSSSAYLGDVGMKWVSTTCDQLPSQELLMRVSSCKFLRPSLVCFSKSSVGHYPPATLNLEDGQQEPACASPGPVPDAPEESPSEEKIEVEKVDDVTVEVILKSSFKRPAESGSKDVAKGRVKWMDFMGKELVEVKEFEARNNKDDDLPELVGFLDSLKSVRIHQQVDAARVWRWNE
ncbi:hypothetical protein Taro_036382, partial [Colocasia esculenta]|nr:hypothetical protein [Colocasia esculenta]